MTHLVYFIQVWTFVGFVSIKYSGPYEEGRVFLIPRQMYLYDHTTST